jgi:hypothetical protein
LEGLHGVKVAEVADHENHVPLEALGVQRALDASYVGDELMMAA